MSTFKNILTFGAYGRIEEAMAKYNKVKNRYNAKLRKMKIKSREVDALLETVVQVKVEAIKDLHTFKELTVGNQEKTLNQPKLSDFKIINQTLANGQLALTAGVGATLGATAGIGTALATWGLVSTLGAASTGTAISALSGAAATNATLAFLGGGSVAAGGGGMIAGTTLLGGMVAIPALVALGVFSHFSAKKKIAEIESAINKMQRYMNKMDRNIIQLKVVRKKAKRLIRLISKKSKKLKYELNIANQMINGEMNKLTCYYHQVRTLLFNRSASKLAVDVAILIDTPIFDEESINQDIASYKRTALIGKMMVVATCAIAFYLFALPVLKDAFPQHTLTKSNVVNKVADVKARIAAFIGEGENEVLESNYQIESEEVISDEYYVEEPMEYNVVTIIITKNYGETQILHEDFYFNTGETMNDVMYKYHDELEMVVEHNRIVSLKGFEQSLNGSERWLAQITAADGSPVDSLESILSDGDIIELDLH
ncbi:hypothetical protein [Litchfieldia salsa]|uniref:Uncharacterized protein n=1 Tax=Litchfieldia salsa TaxID=930152 RepID=A0A1H0W6Z3_9BACI|nr:hypothetical protein [Litchfieldia salsa]SDP86046.1 hypothetical protein SAMN05216565_10999 [Litchfieldia salsa]